MTKLDGAASQTSRISPALATLGVVFASIGFGVVPVFARGLTEAGLAPHAVAFYRYVLVAVVLAPTLLLPRAQLGKVGWGIAAGVVMGLGWVGYVHAIEVAPVGTVGVLYMTYPVFTLILAWALFAEKPSGRATLAAGLILGAAMLAGSAALGPVPLWPLLVALVAPFGFGFGIVVLVHKLSALPPLSRLTSVSLGSVLGLMPLMATSTPSEVLPSDARTWLLVAGIGLGSALIPQLIYTVCSPVIGTARTAMAGAVELPTMFLIGWALYAEPLGVAQWVAGALVVAAILLTPSRVVRNVSTNIART